MKTVNKTKFKTVELVYIAVCTVLIAICSWISIPTVVPFTLQTFAVFCVLELLGGKKGTISILVYILLAVIGVPVLAGFSGGLGAILGTTGGYVIGFILMGLIYMLSEKVFGKSLPIRIAAMVVGLIVCYAFGTAWFMIVYANKTGPVGLWTALTWCVFPFIIPDLCKLALAVLVSSRLRKVL
ncbi:MAG: biotin transporter BioY [Lachnospiraceae bacterium]|nr:biotin transporter BioY [Lachnospiraceae bacterium]